MSEHVERYTSIRGELLIHIPKADVFILKITGHLDDPMGAHVIDMLEKALSTTKRLHLFCDWAEMTGYESEVRAAFTSWAGANRNRVTFHLLVGSKLVAMGVSVANLALGGILIGYASRAAFDATLRSIKMGMSVK